MLRDSSPGLLQETMQDFEDDLQSMLNEWSQAEDELVRSKGRVELLSAKLRIEIKHRPPANCPKPLKDDLDALVLCKLWEDNPELMEAQLNAEAMVAAFKARYKCAESALSSKQTRLNADVKLNLGTSR